MNNIMVTVGIKHKFFSSCLGILRPETIQCVYKCVRNTGRAHLILQYSIIHWQFKCLVLFKTKTTNSIWGLCVQIPLNSVNPFLFGFFFKCVRKGHYNRSKPKILCETILTIYFKYTVIIKAILKIYSQSPAVVFSYHCPSKEKCQLLPENKHFL